jgi:predicted negative regulator of RcsB-dependent stress response
MSSRLPSIVLVLSLTLMPLLAQGQQQPPSKPPTTPPTTPTPPPRDTIPSSPRERPLDTQRPVYVSGKVILEDGTPVPHGVRVEMLLNGQVRRQEYTRSDGSFTFDLSNPNRNMLSDASLSGGNDDGFGNRATGGFEGGMTQTMGRVDLSGWEVRASLPGYQSEVVLLQNRSALDNPDIGTIVMRPLSRVKATTISINALKAPKKAQKSFESALNSYRKSKPDLDKVEKELNKAIKEYPDYSVAWQMLGEIRLQQKDEVAAREAFHKALAADEKYISPYLSLASLDVQEKRWDEAATLTQQLLELNPYVTQARLIQAVANFNLGRHEVAEDAAKQIQTSEDAKEYPISHYILGAVYANRGDYQLAAGEFEFFLKEQPQHRSAADVRRSLQEWRQKGLVAAKPEAAKPAAAVPPSE